MHLVTVLLATAAAASDHGSLSNDRHTSGPDGSDHQHQHQRPDETKGGYIHAQVQLNSY